MGILVESSVYIAVFCLAANNFIEVGRIGRIRFCAGFYFYVGSAQRNLSARLERHARTNKPLQWHIDYLSTKAEMLGAIIIPGKRELECKIARELGRMFELAVPGFGDSDCRCGGHLFYSQKLY